MMGGGGGGGTGAVLDGEASGLRSRQMDPMPRRKGFPGIILPPGGEAGKPNWFFSAPGAGSINHDSI